MIRKIFTTPVMYGFRQNLFASFSSLKDFKTKLENKEYFDILGISPAERAKLKDNKDLHRAYLTQIRKFHSDQVHNEETKKEYDEITKCIAQAYDEIKKKEPEFRQAAKEAELFTDEDEIAEKMFGKRYNDVKMTLYSSGNQKQRTEFIQALNKLKTQKYGSPDGKPKPQAAPRAAQTEQSSSSSQSSGQGLKILGLLALLGIAIVPFLSSSSSKAPVEGAKKAKIPGKLDYNRENVENIDIEKKENVVKEYTEEQLDIIQQNTAKISIKPYENYLNNLMSRRPWTLSYPNQDHHILDQLTTYSVAPDVHFYEIPSDVFLSYKYNDDLMAKNSADQVPKYKITNLKPNTLMTLALEAERCLHNIYINVDDLLLEIKEKGKYTPPKIFFKYYGYIMFELREKTFSTLQNYRNTKYISLFDLYFDFYSPIFFKRSYYNAYLCGYHNKEDSKEFNRYFGNVHINHRSIPPRYIERDQKVVVMRDVSKAYRASGSMKEHEDKYKENWEKYYERFELRWLPQSKPEFIYQEDKKNEDDE